MKTIMPVMALLALLFCQFTGSAQPDTAKIAAKALFYADSLIKTDSYENWGAYSNLVPSAVIKYYGGKDGFVEHVRTARMRKLSVLENEMAPELKVQVLRTENDQWQFVIQESRYIHRDDKKYHVVTYLVGQSKDEGETWKLFDVSYNSVANIIYMFPEVFTDLAIPQPLMLSEEEELARQQAATAQATPPVKAKIAKVAKKK